MISCMYVLLCVYSVVGMFVCLVMFVQRVMNQKAGKHEPWVSHHQSLHSVVHLKQMNACGHVCMHVSVNVYMCVCSFTRTHLFAHGRYLHVPDAAQTTIAT